MSSFVKSKDVANPYLFRKVSFLTKSVKNKIYSYLFAQKENVGHVLLMWC